MACATVLGTITAAAADESIAAKHIYVAPDGSGNGSKDVPFGSIEETVKFAEETDGTVVVELRGGTYNLEKTVEITGSDVVIRSYPGEKAVVTAGNEIAYDSFEKCTDDEFLSKLSDKSAKDKVVCADVDKLGITELGELKLNGYAAVSDRFGYAPTLSCNGSMLTYPNDDYLYHRHL